MTVSCGGLVQCAFTEASPDSMARAADGSLTYITSWSRPWHVTLKAQNLRHAEDEHLGRRWTSHSIPCQLDVERKLKFANSAALQLAHAADVAMPNVQ